MSREMDKIMIEFPLCCLSISGSDNDKVSSIISYYIVEYSKRIESKVEERVDELLEDETPPFGFNKKNLFHKKILLAGDELKVMLGKILFTIKRYDSISTHILNQKLKYGKDSYCRIGKGLCFETSEGKFPYRQFAVLCAIQSILGKKAKFKRITKDRIRFAMHGYKSKQVALTELKGTEKLLSDRQLGTVIDTLHSKGFFSRFTYANRQTFYSTYYKENIDGKRQHSDRLLFEAVKNTKLFWAKKRANISDKEKSEIIKKEIGKLKLIQFDGQLRKARCI